MCISNLVLFFVDLNNVVAAHTSGIMVGQVVLLMLSCCGLPIVCSLSACQLFALFDPVYTHCCYQYGLCLGKYQRLLCNLSCLSFFDPLHDPAARGSREKPRSPDYPRPIIFLKFAYTGTKAATQPRSLLCLSCRYQRLLRKLSRKQRLKMTGQYYTAPRGFFNMSQEMSQSAHKTAAREAAAATAEEGADGADGDEALSIADDDQTEPGLLTMAPGMITNTDLQCCVIAVRH